MQLRGFAFMKKSLLLFVVGVFFVSTMLAGFTGVLFPQSVSAKADVLSQETDLKTVFKTIRYLSAFKQCSDWYKTTVEGDNIEKGPRWWVESGGTVVLDPYLDQWDAKDGLTGCNGETDSDPGWLTDGLKFFGFSTTGQDGLKALGYTCKTENVNEVGTADSKKITCTHSDVRNKSSANSWYGRISNSPYVKNQSSALSSSGDLYKAAAYLGAFKNLEGPCKAKKGGSTNLYKVSTINSTSGAIINQDWKVDTSNYISFLGSSLTSDKTVGLYCKGLPQVTVDNAPSYQKLMYQKSCKASFPTQSSDATSGAWFVSACMTGLAKPTDPMVCVALSNGSPSSAQTAWTASNGMNSCFLAQGHPTDASGVTAGKLCYSQYAYTAVTELSACIAGAKNRTNTNYCVVTYPAPDVLNGSGKLPTDTNKDRRAACQEGQRLAVTNNGITPGFADLTPEATDEEEAAGTESSCGVDGIGWIVCPAMSFMGGLVEQIFPAIADFLKIDLELFNTNSATFTSWVVFRNIANVAFVIVFLIIIFSQLTGAGINNYGVKKMLPRLIMAAILVNVSYYVCQLAVDISNVLGFSLKSVFDGIAVTSTLPTSTDASANGGGIAVLVVAAIGAVGITLALGTLIPVLVGAVVALLGIVLVLILRKALIVILIVIAPLAFVAFLLPNTQPLFDKWRKLFTTLLLLFPIVSLVFGASSLASQILLSTAGSNIGIQIAAFGAMTLPFFVVPTLLKGALDAAGGIGAKINGMTSKIGGGAGRLAQKGASTAYQRSNFSQARNLNKQLKQNYRAEKFAKRLGKSGALQAVAAGGVGITKKGQYMKNAAGRVADDAVHSTRQKEIAAEQRRTAAMPHGVLQAELARAVDSGDHNKARAIQNNLFRTKSGREAYKQTMAGLEADDPRDKKTSSARKAGIKELKENVLENHGDVGDKDNAIMEHASDQSELSIAHHSKQKSTYASLSDAQLASHSAADLATAASTGAIDGERAAKILGNDNINGGIKGSEREVLEAIVSGDQQTLARHQRSLPEKGSAAAATTAPTVSSTATDAAQGAVAFPSSLNPTVVTPAAPRGTPPGVTPAAAAQMPGNVAAAAQATASASTPSPVAVNTPVSFAEGYSTPTTTNQQSAVAQSTRTAATTTEASGATPTPVTTAPPAPMSGWAGQNIKIAPKVTINTSTPEPQASPTPAPVEQRITPAGSSSITNTAFTDVSASGVPQNTPTTSFIDIPMPTPSQAPSQPATEQAWHEKEHEEGRRYQHADDELVIDRASRKEKRVAPKWIPGSKDARAAAESHNDYLRMAREEAERRGLNQ